MNFKYYNTERLILFIIALSIIVGSFVTFWVHPRVEKASESIKTVIIYTEVFSVPFFISIIFSIINSWEWKCCIFKWLLKVPDLSGRYTGRLVSSYMEEGKAVEKKCTLEIKQNASSIHISAYFGNLDSNIQTSNSFGISTEIIEEKNGFYTLYYNYNNETDGLNLNNEFDNHSGTARYKYFPDNKSLKGLYYNQKKNDGQIEVTFEQELLLGRL